MRRTLAAAGIAVGLACSRSETSNKAPTAPTTPPVPFTGTLTIDRIMGARGLVDDHEAWDTAFPKLQSQLGIPMQVDGRYSAWAAFENWNTCAYVVVERTEDGKHVRLYTPKRVDELNYSMTGEWAECLGVAGYRPKKKLQP